MNVSLGEFTFAFFCRFSHWEFSYWCSCCFVRNGTRFSHILRPLAFAYVMIQSGGWLRPPPAVVMKIACEVLRTLYDFSNLRQHLLCIFLLIERLVVDVVKLDSVPTLHQYQIALSRVSLIFEPVRLACLTQIYPDDVDLFILSFYILFF